MSPMVRNYGINSVIEPELWFKSIVPLQRASKSLFIFEAPRI